MIRVQKTQKGFALVTSLLLLLLMTGMGIAMTARSNLNTNMSVEYSRSEHVFFAAEAGIEHARRYLENESSQNKYSGNTNGPIDSEPDNRCLANYKDGIGFQYDTLGKDNGKFAYKFPPAISGTAMQVDSACTAINANATMDKNYRRMDCELDLDNDPNTNDDERNYFKTFVFSYFIFYEGESSDTISTTSTGTGTVGTSTEYGADRQDIAYYYKVISCGAGFEWNDPNKDVAVLKQIQTLEARIKLEK